MTLKIKLAIGIIIIAYLLILYYDPINMGGLTIIGLICWAIREVCIYYTEKID